MQKLINKFKLSKSELDKVIFPTKEQIRQAFIAVFVVVTIIALFLAFVDFMMSLLVSSAV
ncbi:MAG: preprotein translocase subunit SecE [Campylobacterota bacterium]